MWLLVSQQHMFLAPKKLTLLSYEHIDVEKTALNVDHFPNRFI